MGIDRSLPSPGYPSIGTSRRDGAAWAGGSLAQLSVCVKSERKKGVPQERAQEGGRGGSRDAPPRATETKGECDVRGSISRPKNKNKIEIILCATCIVTNHHERNDAKMCLFEESLVSCSHS